jgi:hypothetical protein
VFAERSSGLLASAFATTSGPALYRIRLARLVAAANVTGFAARASVERRFLLCVAPLRLAFCRLSR